MLKRTISSVVLAPIFVYLIYLGEIPFLICVLLICGISAWEFGHIYDQDEVFKIPLALLVISVELLILARWFIGFDASHRVLTGCIMAAMTWGVVACEQGIPKTAVSFAVLTTGMVYIGWLGGYFISLRHLDKGFTKLLLVISFTWSSDIGAYLVGKTIGKHKMAPLVSPHKTWEGFIGGVVFTLATAFFVERFVPAVDAILNARQILVLALMLSICSPIGDLGESMIKRSFNVKDSSHLIPGHGGFFDRFDSMFFSLPIGYYFFEMISRGFV